MHLLLIAALLGIVEGLTEFLPISSTGHLVIFDHWFGFENLMGKSRADAFEIFIQFGAILAVVIYFRQRLLDACRAALAPQNDPATIRSRKFLAGVVLATIPAIIVGLAFHKTVEEKFLNPQFIAWVLIGGGVLLWAVDRWRPHPVKDDAADLDWMTIALIGCGQTLALVLPGFSRAGATIMTAMLLRVTNKAAAEFSFFLAIPTMFMASGYSLYKHRHDLVASDWWIFTVGFVFAFLSALVVVKAFITFLQRHSFQSFAYYRVAFGAVVLATLYFWR